MNYRHILDKQLEVAKFLAPTHESAAGFEKLVAEMTKAGDNPSDILVQLILALTNGLQYGNWLR